MTATRKDGLSVEIVAAVEQVLRRALDSKQPASSRPSPQHASTSPARYPPKSAQLARAIYRTRRDRDALFDDAGLRFGEPGWDIMLDLYCAYRAGEQVPVSSACIASSVAPTTGLRYLAALERSGLVERELDIVDKRRCFVSLTDRGVAMMDNWLSRVGDTMTALAR